MGGYFGVGAARGLQSGFRESLDYQDEQKDRADRLLDRAEQRRLRDRADQRAEQQSALQGEEANYERGLRPLKERALTAGVESSEVGAKAQKVGLEAAETQLAYTKEDRPRSLARQKVADDTASFALSSAKSRENREQSEFDRKTKDAVRQAQDEGFVELLDSLEAGADPNYALSRYNSRGKFGIRPGTLKYDSESGALSFVHIDGKEVQNFNGTIDQLRSVPGLARNRGSVTKLGEGDRLIRTDKAGNTTDVTPPEAPGSRGGSKFNPQTFVKEAENSVGELLGAKFDNGTQSFRYDDLNRDRGNVSTAFVGRITRALKDAGVNIGGLGGVAPGEVAAIAVNAARKVIGADDAEEAVKADPKWKGSKPQEIAAEVDRRVQQSKIAAAVQLKADIENFVRTKSVIQEEQQAGEEARANDLPDAKPSAEIGDPSIAAGAPTADAFKGLAPGKALKRRDGSVWKLGRYGPVRIDRKKDQ